MMTKFLFTRAYTFEAEKGARKHYFFELVNRYGEAMSVRLRDKDNADVIDLTIEMDGDVGTATFLYYGKEYNLRADRFIPKGFKAPRLPEPELKLWAETREDVLKDAYIYNCDHRAELEATEQCGCYYCKRIFSPSEIEEWTHGNETAICPYCGVDSVIPNVPGVVKITPELLSKLNKKYF